jgi:hypothetical protein
MTAFVQAGTHPFNDSEHSQYPGTVNFFVNGQNVGSRNVSDPSDTVSLSCPSGASGTATAQVIDSVLYDSTSDGQSINFTQAVAQNIHIVTATQTSASWTGGQSGTTYTVIRTDTNATLCTTTSTACVYSSIPKNTTIKVSDNSGDNPDTKKAT